MSRTPMAQGGHTPPTPSGHVWSKDFLDSRLVDCSFSMLKDKRLPQQMNLLHFRKKLPPIFNLKQKFSFLRTLWVDLKIRYAVAGSFRNIVYTYIYVYFLQGKLSKLLKFLCFYDTSDGSKPRSG